ncbi:hypothetical protein [Cellulomonas sp. KRMCY2]|uniref:hypothetical protein n=1 Tax=Cellulomonas sp. KRMCY2 TaxID=1304865 RepID=UPI00045EA0E5|nr:hypothetical protein [Cellulomonas sp. KRMCY2]
MVHAHAARARALFAAALIPLAVTSCGTSADAPATPADLLSQRDELPSCGVLELDQGEVVPEAAWDCLDEGSEAGAELVVSMPTTEGDPIVTYYRVGAGIEGLELFIDNSADVWAGPDNRGVSHQLCPATATAREPLGCREVT